MIRRTAALLARAALPRAALLLAALPLTALLLAGCSASPPPTVQLTVGGQSVELLPTQYCLDGKPQLYAKDDPSQRPPVLRVGADQKIAIEVPAAVADSGWQVQIFDQKLDQQLGQVPVGNRREFDTITTSDAVPAAYYLVVVQDAGSGCNGLSGAWPVGFVRS